MLRVNSTNVLVVPPLECAWLSGDKYQLQDEAGCVSFEVKGENDATVILKPTPGSKRWQFCQRETDGLASSDRNYTIILGSHRNSCLKVERDGQLACVATAVPGACLSAVEFTRFWIAYNHGCIAVGCGVPGTPGHFAWADPEPLPGIQYVGLSTWDKHVAYRHIRVDRCTPVALSPACPPSSSPSCAVAAATETSASRSGRQSACMMPPQALPLPQRAPLPSLEAQCCAAVQRELCEASVCSVLQVADILAPALAGLREAGLRLLAARLPAVMRTDPEGLCALALGTWLDLLRHPALACPERLLFQAVMTWAQHGCPDYRASSALRPLSEVEQLLPLVRFPLMLQEELQEVSSHEVASCSRVLQELLAEAMEGRLNSENLSPTTQVQAPKAPVSVQGKRHLREASAVDADMVARFQRRHAPGCRELMYVCDGDHNGVAWHLGTGYGRQGWVNPVVQGRMQVRVSSPVCRHTDPKALVSGNFVRYNHAGPRSDGAGGTATWWLMDQGPAHRLMVNYYTLRQDGSAEYVRDWVLQASHDGKAWVDLRRHVSDTTLQRPGQYASWPVTGHASARPYRLFRVLLGGPSAAGTHNLCLSYWELYGYFFREGSDELAA